MKFSFPGGRIVLSFPNIVLQIKTKFVMVIPQDLDNSVSRILVNNKNKKGLLFAVYHN